MKDERVIIKLEPLTVDEVKLSKMAEWRNDPDNHGALRSYYPTHSALQKEWARAVIADKTKAYYFISILGGTRDFIGYCGLDKIHEVNRTAELSLLIDGDHQRRGIGTSAVEEILARAFELLNINCVFIEAYLTDDRWQFWGKQGFKTEGVLRSRKYYNNDYHNSVVASILKEEWNERRTKSTE